MDLYRWQRECLRAWQDNGFRGIVHVSTGAGKTVLALAAIRALREQWPYLEVKVVVPTLALARQWSAALTRSAPSGEWRPGFFGGGRRDESDRRAMIYIVNSARGALAAHMRRAFALGHHVLLICDECHHYQSPQNRRIFDFIAPPVLEGGLYACLGLSATPFGGEDDCALERALGGVIYRYDIGDAVSDGVLSAFSVGSIGTSFNAEEGDAYAEFSDLLARLSMKLRREYPFLNELREPERLRAIQRLARDADMDPSHPAAAYVLALYRRKEVSVLARARMFCCADLLATLRREDRVLVFCERIEQAEATAAVLRRCRGGGVGIYHSGMSAQARARNMEAFRTGELRVLVSCRCLDEGIDVPDANIGIVMSGCATLRQRVQRMGRILRTAPGKDAACLYYIYIRESADDAVYLPGLERCEAFDLRYYPPEEAFSNEIYESAAARLIERAKEMRPEHQRELRACLLEGLTRADCLLDLQVIERRIRDAKGIHERNYWRCMKSVAAILRGKEP